MATSTATTAFASALDATKCLSVRGTITEGARTELQTCDGSVNQQFVVQSSTGEITINGTLCLDDYGGDNRNYDPIVVWGCHGRSNQKWTITPAGEIRGAGGKCVDILNATAVNGQALILYTCHGAANQRWALSTSTPTLPIPSGILSVVPGLAGFGVTTPAGRGGAVLRVTNLNDNGTGSLRAALEASGPRTIVFEVGGTIALSSPIVIRNPFFTLAGQTAPAPGIAIRGAGLSIRTHDALIQHIRVRPGDGPGTDPGNRDAIEMLGPNGYNLVLDHVSASWAIDENMSTWYEGMHDITIANSIIAEGLNNSLHPEGGHSMGLLLGYGMRNFALIGSLLAHNVDRNPWFQGGTTAAMVNNIVYDWAGNQATYLQDATSSGAQSTSLVGNVYVRGPSNPTGRAIQVFGSVGTGTKVYIADNSLGWGAPPGDAWSLVKNDAGSRVIVAEPPVWPTGLIARPNRDVPNYVLGGAGAWPGSRDAADSRVVSEVRSGTGRIVDSQNQVGGYPNLGTPRQTLTLPANPNGDDDGDGYTNLEEWLHQFAARAEGR